MRSKQSDECPRSKRRGVIHAVVITGATVCITSCGGGTLATPKVVPPAGLVARAAAIPAVLGNLPKPVGCNVRYENVFLSPGSPLEPFDGSGVMISHEQGVLYSFACNSTATAHNLYKSLSDGHAALVGLGQEAAIFDGS